MLDGSEPVAGREHRLADGLRRIHRERAGWLTSEVHVHLDGDALVCVIEDPGFPRIDPRVRAEIHSDFAALVTSVLGRPACDRFEDSQPTSSIHVSLLRLT